MALRNRKVSGAFEKRPPGQREPWNLAHVQTFFSPGARFSKAPKTFRARKATFRSTVCKNGEVYTPETSCMKWTSLHIKKMWIKQLCKRKVPDFALALRARKVSGAFEKRAPVLGHETVIAGYFAAAEAWADCLYIGHVSSYVGINFRYISYYFIVSEVGSFRKNTQKMHMELFK